MSDGKIFKYTISHSSAKSLFPPLHKFTIQNLDLAFPFLGKKRFVHTDLSIFGEDGKKLSRQKVGLHLANFP